MSIDQIIAAAGGGSRLAAALGITPAAVSQWREVPVARARKVSTLTGLPLHEVCPAYWPPPDQQQPSQQG